MREGKERCHIRHDMNCRHEPRETWTPIVVGHRIETPVCAKPNPETDGTSTEKRPEETQEERFVFDGMPPVVYGCDVHVLSPERTSTASQHGFAP